MNKVFVFSTTFCQKCPSVKKQMTQKEIPYEAIDAVQFPSLVKQYGVKSVPHVIVEDDNGNVVYSKGGEFQDFEQLKGLTGV